MTNTLIGRTIGQYRILSEIGRGGMAIVYKAEQVSLGRFVALKILFPNFTGDTSAIDRLKREAKAAAGLDHPNIVQIYEVGSQDDLHFIAMKYVEGLSLDEILKAEGGLAPDRVIRILAQVASALDYAHRRNLVHRDIKPSNILVGASDRVTLTDFGLVKAMGSATLTHSGALVGTPTYMSPEQARGVETDYRADIYSLAIVGYEMLTGRPPFEGDPLSIILAHASREPPGVRAFRSEIPPWVESAVHKALAKEPGDRYTTSGEFVATLRQAFAFRGSGPLPAVPLSREMTPPDMPAAVARKPSARIRWLIGAATVVAVAALAWLVLLLTRPADQNGEPTDMPAPVALVATITATSPSPTPTLQPTATEVRGGLPSTPAALVPTATPTVVAATATTTPSPTATSTVLPTETHTPSPTPSPTASSTQTAAATPTPSTTYTSTSTSTATSTATSEPSATATRPASSTAAIPTRPPVRLLGPPDGQVYQESETPTLLWDHPAALGADEQFVVVIERIPLPPNVGIWHDYQITREKALVLPHYLAETSADGRLSWYVQIMRSARLESNTLAGQPVGSPSPKRSLVWRVPPPTIEPVGTPIPKPTPTRDD